MDYDLHMALNEIRILLIDIHDRLGVIADAIQPQEEVISTVCNCDDCESLKEDPICSECEDPKCM